jgi:aldehyde dehydrogenase (NAD(P)+)
VQAAGQEDIDIAVKSSHAALKDPSWSRLPASDRGALMARLADLMEENKELFATIDAWDNGDFLIP